MIVDTTYLRPMKAECLERLYNSYREIAAHPGIRRVCHVTLTPEGQRPGVDTGNQGLIVDDCDFCASVTPDTGSEEQIRQIGGRVLYGGFLRNQWGHFLLNSTARLWPMFGDGSMEFDHILFFADTPGLTLSGNYREFMELAGIAGKVVIADTPVRVTDLTIPGCALMHYESYSRRMRDIFDTVRHNAIEGMPSTPQPSGKVFLTRSRLKGAEAHEINLLYIDRFFQHNGFDVLSPEKMSLTSLIQRLAACSEIASVSGSLAHNFLFAPDNAGLLTIERTAANNPFQVAIALMTGHPITCIDAFRLPKIATSTGNLFLYAATPQLRRFAADRHMIPPEIPEDMSHRRRELRKYMSTYRHLYGHSTGINLWETGELPAIAEAYAGTAAYYDELLTGGVCLMPADYLSPRMLARTIIRRLRKK